MKGATVQIAWHGSEPVLSLDFHNQSGLLATAGADHDIKLWSVRQKENGAPTVEFEADLCYHSKAVNVIRFSPSGQLLASGGDGGEILIWKPIERADKKPSWKVLKTLQLHVRDVLDLAWSPDSLSLMSGSVDNQCMIWDVATGKVLQVLNDHLHFVQGVAWDPAGDYLASISSDRTCRIYSRHSAPKSKKRKLVVVQNMFTCKQVLAKAEAAPSRTSTAADVDGKAAKAQQLFHDETLPSFFRRLAWSPDASFLIVPSGLHKMVQEAPPCNMSFIYSRKDLSRPCIHLPAPSKPVVAVRFCPVIFSLMENETVKETGSGFALPYRLVFAVATLDSLFIYDTQHSEPIIIFAGIHYAAITDIAWSADAQYVAVSSQDGYCSLLVFSENGLGTRLPSSEVPASIAKYLPETLLEKAQQSLKAVAVEVSPVSLPTGLMSDEPVSPITICPRPLKHRRITPTALPPSSSPSVQKHHPVIVPTSISVSASPHKQRRITPTALAEDSPSSSGNCVETVSEIVDTPLTSQTSLPPVQAPDPVENPCSSQEANHGTPSTHGVSSPGSKKRLCINPVPIPDDPPGPRTSYPSGEFLSGLEKVTARYHEAEFFCWRVKMTLHCGATTRQSSFVEGEDAIALWRLGKKFVKSWVQQRVYSQESHEELSSFWKCERNHEGKQGNFASLAFFITAISLGNHHPTHCNRLQQRWTPASAQWWFADRLD